MRRWKSARVRVEDRGPGVKREDVGAGEREEGRLPCNEEQSRRIWGRILPGRRKYKGTGRVTA